MLETFRNAWKVEDLRKKIIYTLIMLLIYRVGSVIPTPGVNVEYIAQQVNNISMLGMLDFINGQNFSNFTIFAMGISPYITSSIIMQLLTIAIPSLERLQKEGEEGRKKIAEITRVVTIALGCIMALGIILGLGSGAMAKGANANFFDYALVFVVLAAGTAFTMWIGERITENGIGNGVSLIITIGIVSRLPQSVIELVQMAWNGQTPDGTSFKPVQLLLLLVVFCVVTAATIMLSQGYRRVPIQMIRKTVGKQMTGGATYMPLKVNFANVMPIIFAGAILMLPEYMFRYFASQPDASTIWNSLALSFQNGGTGYMIAYALLILAFSFFWVANQFNPIQIADNLKKEGAFIPGISPGQPTADFLDTAMTRVTAGGAVFLMALALFPMFLYSSFKIPFMVAQFFGGTSLLIMVGVVLDTMSQLESHLTMRHYEGFLKSGRLRSRSGN